jgi:hypothetical protein
MFCTNSKFPSSSIVSFPSPIPRIQIKGEHQGHRKGQHKHPRMEDHHDQKHEFEIDVIPIKILEHFPSNDGEGSNHQEREEDEGKEAEDDVDLGRGEINIYSYY